VRILKCVNERKKIFELLNSDKTIGFINKYSISSLLVFGSLNGDTFNEESDVDIAIIGNNKIDLDEILELELFLENLLNREIDVIDLKSENLDLFVKINILNEGEVIYSSDNNMNLNKFKEKTDLLYKENENFIYFRKRDVLS
jgi:Predicted nucleotidyltransferases